MAEEISLGGLTAPKQKPSKRRGPRVILSDGPLWNHRNQLVQIFENSWGEIGWQLQTLKKPDDIIPPFSIHPNTWIRNELAVFLHPGSTAPENPRKLRSRLDAVTRLLSKSDETFRRASEEWERAQQVPSGVNRKLRRLIISERGPIRRRYARAKQTCVALVLEEKQLQDRLRSAESEFARNEAFDFLNAEPRRYELTPLHLANALAGLPYTKWRRSMTRCVDAGLDVFKNHLRVYDTKKMRTTFVGTRWDLVEQDDLLLMKAVQPVCDRLRYDMFPPGDMVAPHDDYRRSLESHPFRTAVVGQLKPQSGVVRFDQLDASPYLIGMPGGMVADLRTGVLRNMERADFLTKRLRIVATNTPTPVYDYFLRSISSANDQPADLEWMSHFELLHGYFLIGHYNFHIWPIFTGVGGNGKSENARLIKSTLGDFCAVVRWSELTHDERGGDNTTKRLNFKLLQSRVALVEEMGQTSGINRVLETSTIKQLTGGGEIIGADLYRSEVHGEVKFKLVSLMNEAPHIEPDPAFKRRVQVFPFRARFDEVVNPGCIELAMKVKNAPSCLREAPHRLSTMLREERQGILYRWIQAARRFISNGEELGNMPSSVREATAAMFHEADLHGRLVELLQFGDESFDVSKGEMLAFGESFFRENGRDPRSFDMGKLTALLAEKVGKPAYNIMRDGQRKEGWRRVRLAPGVPVVLIGK